MNDRKLRGWLLQVLKTPYKPDPTSPNPLARLMGNPFAFGGGGSGLSKEAKDIVYALWDFEYMGNAEYEFGALPEALHRIGTKPKLVAYEKVVPASKIKPDEWTRGTPTRKREKKKEFPPVQDVTCYIICDESEKDDVEYILMRLAAGKQECKASPRADYFFDPISEYSKNMQGWVDVTSPGGFFIFKDKEMWEATKKAFGVA